MFSSDTFLVSEILSINSSINIIFIFLWRLIFKYLFIFSFFMLSNSEYFLNNIALQPFCAAFSIKLSLITAFESINK